MRILALYGSKFGQAEAVLRRIGAALQVNGHTVHVVSASAMPDALDLEDFDGVLIAASVMMGRYHVSVRRFVRAHVATLNALPTAFVSVSGAQPESSPAWYAYSKEYVARFLERSGWRPRWTARFAGALRYTRYDFVTRWVMKRISRKRGGPTDTSRDHDFTDWDAVDRFAADLSDALREEEAGEVAVGDPSLRAS